MTTALILTVITVPVVIAYIYIKQESDQKNRLNEIKKILSAAKF